MRAVVQRVSAARVTVGGEEVGRIGTGLAVLVGVAEGDDLADAAVLAGKVVGLRVFADGEGRMNRSLGDVGGEVLLVSQFTLLGDVRNGRRPSFTEAAAPEAAEPLIEAIVARIEEAGIRCATGRFGAYMEVALTNDGPVTLVIDVAGGGLV